MNRKSFISSIIPAVISVSGVSERSFTHDHPLNASTIPPYLKSGDTIAITSPAGFITLEDCGEAIKTMEGWGFITRIGNTIGKRDFSFGGTDEERIADLQQQLDDENIKAVMCARGGYGIIRIIDKINFRKFSQKPKWIIGFSDATVLHSHINKNFGIATIHSKMCNSFIDPAKAETVQWEAIDAVRKCLTGEKISYDVIPNPNNRLGSAEGKLIGGNLKTLETLAGSSSDISTKNKILFVEDTGEYLYSIDRMFWNLKRSGKLSNLAGLIIGGFKIKKDDEGEAFGKTLEQIVLEKTAAYKYPVCFDFPVGHQKNNVALKCGAAHRLEVNTERVSLRSTE